jgi:rRNA biogenesis protein RRP5
MTELFLSNELISNSYSTPRAVLERTSKSNLPMKKMRGVFKKYLAFEMTHGTAQQREAVRLRAESYLDEKLQ